MSKKRIVLIIIFMILAISAIIVGVLTFNYYTELNLKKDITKRSGEFVTIWGNFKDETSPEYIDSWSKYVDDSISTDAKDSAGLIIGMRGDKPAVTSSFIVTGDTKTTKDKEIYHTEVTGIRKYSDYRGTYNETVFMTWEKVGNTYVITDVYTVNNDSNSK